MTLTLASVLLSLLNLASAALIADHRRVGWLVALGAQIPWTWYDVWTRQLGFLLLTLIYLPVYVRGWRKAPRPTSQPSRQPIRSPQRRPLVGPVELLRRSRQPCVDFRQPERLGRCWLDVETIPLADGVQYQVIYAPINGTSALSE